MPLHLSLRALVFVLFFFQLAPIVYHTETIDSLGYSPYVYVEIEGTVSGVSREDGIDSFRLLDRHGHARVCVLPKGMAVPTMGAHLRVQGTRKYWPQTGVAEIDPVAAIEPVENQ